MNINNTDNTFFLSKYNNYLPKASIFAGALHGLAQRVIENVSFGQSDYVDKKSLNYITSALYEVGKSEILRNKYVITTVLSGTALFTLSRLNFDKLKEPTLSIWKRCKGVLNDNPQLWRVAEAVTVMALPTLYLWCNQEVSGLPIAFLATSTYALTSLIKGIPDTADKQLVNKISIPIIFYLSICSYSEAFSLVFENKDFLNIYMELITTFGAVLATNLLQELEIYANNKKGNYSPPLRAKVN